MLGDECSWRGRERGGEEKPIDWSHLERPFFRELLSEAVGVGGRGSGITVNSQR